MIFIKTKRFFKNISLGLVIIGFSLVTAFIIDYFYQQYFGEPINVQIPQQFSGIISTPTPEEKEPTEQEVVEHQVALNEPRYFSLPTLGITKARILQVAEDPQTHEIGTPLGIYDVGWFNKSGFPGQGQTIILDGHNGGPTREGIFKRLNKATLGNEVIIERGDGQIFSYTIVDNYVIDIKDFNHSAMDKITSKINDKETVAIITCSGRWLSDRQTYDQRTIVKAVKQ
ncbi:MAG: class F sortase [Candidatus Saccharibacteria bacterium]|nr:class F sortase [Candidatus Saccharibacteria bacterium]